MLQAAFPALTTAPGAAITATATRTSSGETSEFSACANASAFGSQPTTDVDGDGLTDVHEVTIGSDPNNADTDNDGIDDGVDNCILAANFAQVDSDGDGFGNDCDADLNNDGTVDFLDLGEMKAVFFTADADADLNGDTVVDFLDLGIMKQDFFKAPGPSGLVP